MTDATPIAATGRPASAILLLVSGLGVGGAERLTLQLARGLVESGWRVIVVGLETDVELLEQVDTTGFDVRALNMSRRPTDIARGLLELIRIVRRERIGLIHAHLFHSLVVGYLLRMIAPRARVVFTSHNYGGFSPRRAAFLHWTRVLRDADILFGPDQHPELNTRRVSIIPNGVPFDAHRAPRRAPSEREPVRFLYLGRLTPEKHVDLLIRAMAEIEAMRRDGRISGIARCELWISGDGPTRPKLEQLVDQLALRGLVRFLGMQSRVAPLFEQCHALVMASEYEGLPMAVLEAGAVAMPVIAPPVGGLPTILGDRCGYLTAPSGLVATMIDVLRDPQESLRRGARLRQRVGERFSMQSCLSGHLDLYRAVLQ
ncbi:MAG: glycosyltransferase [Burkholderiaceae bacterium]